MSNRPECDKLLAVKDQSQIIGEFLEWLINKDDSRIAKFSEIDKMYCPNYESTEKLLARYFKIDLKKLEKEKRALAELSAAQKED